MAKIPTTLHEINILLEEATVAMKRAKRDDKKKKIITCSKCEKPPKYKGLCQEHLDEERNMRIDEKHGKRWFSDDGYERTYDSRGKPVLYASYRMAQLLGRPLQEHESVGRIDGDRRNNEDDNLVLIARPGINLSHLHCSCGLPYFRKGEGPLMQLPDLDK